MRVLFMGTPDLSRTVLTALAEAGHEIVLAVTQPDKAKGRSKTLQASPVKEEALMRGIPVFQPERIRTEENMARLKAFLAEHPADVGAVAAFGQILPEELLRLPRFGCLNVHTSLLPKYRGASPVEAAILAGESVTGVTIMQMDAGIDTGDILLQEELPIDPSDTAETLTDKLAALGGRLMAEALRRLEEGSLSPRPQEGESCYAGLIRKEQGEADWNEPAALLERRLRAYTPWPGLYTFRGGKRLKITRAAVLSEAVSVEGNATPAGTDAVPETAAGFEPGTVLGASPEGIRVATGEGVLLLQGLQPEGKKEMDAAAYLRGYAIKAGERLGASHE